MAQEVVACVRVYLDRVARRTRAAEASELDDVHAANPTILTSFLALVDWTLQYGFHAEELDGVAYDPSNIHWPKTMHEAMPMHVGHSVIYSDLISRRANYQLGPLAYLQANAVLSLFNKLAPASFIWLSKHDPMLETASTIVETGPTYNTALAADQVLNHYATTNQDHERELAAVLYDYLMARQRGPSYPVVYGTTRFEYVWEDMCRIATLQIGSAREYGRISSQPVYHSAEEKLDPLRPDITRQSEARLYILDAKWYDFANNELPGAQDISKQMLYELTISEASTPRISAFLLPMADAKENARLVDQAAMVFNANTDSRFPPVYLIGLRWTDVARLYCGLTSGERIAGAIVNSLP